MRRTRASSVITPAIEFDRDSEKSLQRQIYEGYRTAILRGRLAPGLPVPSTRTLARELSVSRNTVMLAFEQLLAEGYLQSRPGGGTFVSQLLPEQMTNTPEAEHPKNGYHRHSPRHISRAAQRLLAARPDHISHGFGAFRMSPALDQFPVELWSRLISKHSHKVSRQLLGYCDPAGYQPLREAIAEYLRIARATNCSAEQVVVVSGSQHALHLISRVLLNPGDKTCIEEPGYSGARDAFLAAGASLVPVAVDDDGLQVHSAARHTKIRAVYVTPSHHYPLGMTMSLPRRLELLEWAHRSGIWVIEDDYDSEYRYVTRPIACLQGVDDAARVIYVGTFSKVLFPSLRIGYMVVPGDLVGAFSKAKRESDLFSPMLYQVVLSEFIRKGYFGRHLRRMRRVYEERINLLKIMLEREFPDLLQVSHAESGTYLTAILRKTISDVELAIRAGHEGVYFTPLSTSYISRRSRMGLILGIGSTDKRQIGEGVARLKAILHRYIREPKA